MPVKKSELASRLAEKMGVTKKQGVEWLDAFVDEVTKVMRSGDKVNITGFGIFKVSDRKAREGRNIYKKGDMSETLKRTLSYQTRQAKESF